MIIEQMQFAPAYPFNQITPKNFAKTYLNFYKCKSEKTHDRLIYFKPCSLTRRRDVQ
ncbi:hypothetical protein [Moraxella lacunata]|uniref:hypothetical protein n=1 Tax=Moraxella lacunata TaxID=477 RepID=UPI003EE0E4F2